MKDNPCVKFAYYNGTEKVYKPKKRFETEAEAIENAKIVNKKLIDMDKLIYKLVAYKCTKCGGWHIGRNNKPISEKNRLKIKNQNG